MSGVRVVSSLGDLERDLREVAPKAKAELKDVVREAVKVGNQVAKDYARQSAGKHGKLYPRSFTTTIDRSSGLFGNTYSGEYGPDPALPQGGMSFEFGSRNQKPHLDLARSADLIGDALPGEVRVVLDRLFW